MHMYNITCACVVHFETVNQLISSIFKMLSTCFWCAQHTMCVYVKLRGILMTYLIHYQAYTHVTRSLPLPQLTLYHVYE